MQIMTLNDGTTWGALAGCAIYEVPDGIDTEEVKDALSSESARLVRSFNATEPTRRELARAGGILRECVRKGLADEADDTLALATRLEGRA